MKSLTTIIAMACFLTAHQSYGMVESKEAKETKETKSVTNKSLLTSATEEITALLLSRNYSGLVEYFFKTAKHGHLKKCVAMFIVLLKYNFCLTALIGKTKVFNNDTQKNEMKIIVTLSLQYKAKIVAQETTFILAPGSIEAAYKVAMQIRTTTYGVLKGLARTPKQTHQSLEIIDSDEEQEEQVEECPCECCGLWTTLGHLLLPP